MSLICHYASLDLFPIIRMQFGEENVVHIGHRSEEESRHEENDAVRIAGLCLLSDRVRGGAGHGGCHLQ
jgi:hypothetical protein